MLPKRLETPRNSRNSGNEGSSFGVEAGKIGNFRFGLCRHRRSQGRIMVKTARQFNMISEELGKFGDTQLITEIATNGAADNLVYLVVCHRILHRILKEKGQKFRRGH